MNTTCPECRAGFRAKPGATVPCPGCGNPVVVPETSTADARPEKRASTPQVDAPEPTPAPQLPWMMVTVVLAVLAVAHYGLYLLITATARAEIEEHEARHGAGALHGAKDPGKAPVAGSEAFADWTHERELWTASIAYEDARKERRLVNTGLLLAYVLQVGFMGWALYSMSAKQKRASRRRAR